MTGFGDSGPAPPAEPRYVRLEAPRLEMSAHTLNSRREMARSLCAKYGIEERELDRAWADIFLGYLESHGDNVDDPARYRALFEQRQADPRDRVPFHFVTLLDYSLFSVMDRFQPGEFYLHDGHYFDTSASLERSFFCVAGQFSYVNSRAIFTMGETENDLEQHLEAHAALTKEYYGREIHRVERHDSQACDVLLVDPPEVSRNDCLSTAIIFFQRWMDLCPAESVGGRGGHWFGRELSCVALGDSECRLRIGRA